MIRRRHLRPCGTRAEAAYSPCGAYRYALTLRWADGPRLLWVMLNPSAADERANDPTIERCARRSCALGFGAMRAVNLYAFRATRPADLFAAADPVGPGNDAALRAARRWADAVILGWGVQTPARGAQGLHTDRIRFAHRLFRGADCLGTTRGGDPRHPLYVPYAALPRPFVPA